MNHHAFYKPFLLILFLIFYFGINAQSLYEIKFDDKNKNSYKALLVFFHDNNSYMRVSYNDMNGYNVVEIRYKMEYGTATNGQKYCMLKKVTNPAFITVKFPNQTYNADYFLWFLNSTTGQYDTPYTTDDSTFNSVNYRKVISYQKLNPLTLTETYLRGFFGSNEPKYTDIQKMCGVIKVPTKSATYSQNTKLHFILVAATNDIKIGTSCRNDRFNLVNQFKGIATALGVGYQDYIVEGDQFTKANVLAKLNSVFPGKNDIVVFIYRGHGFRWNTQTEKWPRLALKSSYEDLAMNNSNSLGLKEINDIISRKGARLNLVLGDCCNNELEQTIVTNFNFWQNQVTNKTDISKLRSLFMNSSGNIISAAAKPGEVSYADIAGGLYSLSFVQALDMETSYFTKNNCKWENILSNTVRFAWDKSMQGCVTNCVSQNGISQVNVVSTY